MTEIQFYILAYLAVGTALAIASSRRLNIYDQALALVLFWFVFVVNSFLSVVVRAVEGFFKEIINKIKARKNRG